MNKTVYIGKRVRIASQVTRRERAELQSLGRSYGMTQEEFTGAVLACGIRRLTTGARRDIKALKKDLA